MLTKFKNLQQLILPLFLGACILQGCHNREEQRYVSEYSGDIKPSDKSYKTAEGHQVIFSTDKDGNTVARVTYSLPEGFSCSKQLLVVEANGLEIKSINERNSKSLIRLAKNKDGREVVLIGSMTLKGGMPKGLFDFGKSSSDRMTEKFARDFSERPSQRESAQRESTQRSSMESTFHERGGNLNSGLGSSGLSSYSGGSSGGINFSSNSNTQNTGSNFPSIGSSLGLSPQMTLGSLGGGSASFGGFNSGLNSLVTNTLGPSLGGVTLKELATGQGGSLQPLVPTGPVGSLQSLVSGTRAGSNNLLSGGTLGQNKSLLGTETLGGNNNLLGTVTLGGSNNPLMVENNNLLGSGILGGLNSGIDVGLLQPNLIPVGGTTNPLKIGNILGFSPQLTLGLTKPASNVAELLPLVTLNSDKLDQSTSTGFLRIGKKYLESVAISLEKSLESTAESVIKLATDPLGAIEDVAEAIENLPKLKDYIVDYCEKFPELPAEEMAEDLGIITSEILFFWAGGWTKIISKTPGAVSKIGKAACRAMKWPWKNVEATIYELRSVGGSCKLHAEKINFSIGGKVILIKDSYGAPLLGKVYTKDGKLISNEFFHHYAVRKGDFIYDRITGPCGLHLNEYKKLFEHGEYLDFNNFI